MFARKNKKTAALIPIPEAAERYRTPMQPVLAHYYVPVYLGAASDFPLTFTFRPRLAARPVLLHSQKH